MFKIISFFLLAASIFGCQDTNDLNTSYPSATISPGPGSIPLTADEPLRLLSASLNAQMCSSCILLSGAVEVKNLAYDKKIDVVYGCPVNSSDPEGEWQWRKAAAFYQQSLTHSNSEIWQFYVQNPGCYDHVRFAVAYEANGTTYWENNCGWNYEIKWPAGSTHGGVSGRTRSCLAR